MKKYLLLMLSLTLIVFSCSDGDDDPVVVVEEPALTLINSTVDFSNGGGTQSISFETKLNWTAKSSETWCDVSPKSGGGGLKVVTITANANKEYDNRSCSITITSGNLSKTITVKQGENLGLLVSQERYELSNNESTIEVEVKANVDFEIDISNDWITDISMRGLVSTKLEFLIAKNEQYDSREGTITIAQKGGSMKSVIKVFQSQEDAIIISERSVNISSEAQSVNVEVKTNVDLEVIIPEAAKNWVTYSSTRALRTETLILNISENRSADARSSEVYVKNKATKLQDTLTIVQEKGLGVPVLTTIEAYDVLAKSAKTGGVITFDGGGSDIEKGVCWGVVENPTIEDSKIKSDVATDSFDIEITGLEANTTYYARAFAENKWGISYGNEITFTTLSIVATPVISPSGGTFSEAQTITMTCDTEEAKIMYTLDGSDPNESSTLYTGYFAIDESMTVKAKAFKTGSEASSIVAETYVFTFDGVLIEGTEDAIQHLDVWGDFKLRFKNLNNKDVFFVFSNKNESNKVPLPKLESAIVPHVNNVNRSAYTVTNTSPFLVSGKPSVTKFNNNAHKQFRKGAVDAQHQQQLKQQSAILEVGSEEVFYDLMDRPVNSTMRKMVSANGKNLYMWVADNCWGADSPKKYHLTQPMLEEFAYKFLKPDDNNDIYEWVKNIAGDPWGYTGYSNLIDETDDIHIWLTDIDNDNSVSGTLTLGYYYARDNFTKDTYPSSNEKLMFTIDAVLLGVTNNGVWKITDYWPSMLISTLAHEFTHMIYFYQKQIVSDQESNTAINEMCAQCVEDLVANKIYADGPRGVHYTSPSAGYSGNYEGRLPLYNLNNDYKLLEWSSDATHTLINYSKTYALGAYMMRNYGGANLIKELVQNNYTGVESVEHAVNAGGGGGLSYIEILQKFGASNLLSDRTDMTTGYKFNTGNWSTSISGSVTYQLGSINLFNYQPTPYLYDRLPLHQEPGSNLYYKAGSNLNGINEWHFEGVEEDIKVTIIVK